MSLWSTLLRLSPDEVLCERRGFEGGDDHARRRIEAVGSAFLEGYHHALAERHLPALVRRLDDVDDFFRGFAFEGAAMAVCLIDALSPVRRRRLASFLAGEGAAHRYMLHVGAGWAMARLPVGRWRLFRRLDPVLRWLALDGYGFHQGYFHWPKSIAGTQEVPRRVSGYRRRAFDQGLGRSLWFVDTADVDRLPQTVARFPPERRADLWSGVGLACAYAGGVGRAEIERLAHAADGYRGHLAQGAAFAAAARERAGNPSAETERACAVLCGRGASETAEMTELEGRRLPPDNELPAYEVWRRRVRSRLTA